MFPVLFSWGPITITSYGVLSVIAFFLGAFIVWKKGREEHFEEEELFDFTLLATFWGIVGARLWYIAWHFAQFGWEPLKWVTLVRHPGLSAMGALLVGLVAVILFAVSKKWAVWEILDVMVLGVASVQPVLFLAAFLNGSGYGVRSQLPWAVTFPGVEGARHPTQLYGLVLALLLFWLLMKVFAAFRTYDWYKGKSSEANGGLVACVYGVGFGILSVIVSVLTPVDVWWLRVDMGVWLGVGWLLVGMVVGYMRSGRKLRDDWKAMIQLGSRLLARKLHADKPIASKETVTPQVVHTTHRRHKRGRSIVAGMDVK